MLTLTPMGLRCGNRVLPCAIGRGGLADAKREGDGATPRGTHRILGCFYRADRLPAPAAWAMPIGPRDRWSDDPAQPDYNRRVLAPYTGSCETMRRADRQYDIVLTTDWNMAAPVPGHGSAIFVHAWRKPRHPTAGCLALALPDLLWLVRQIEPGVRLHIS